MNLLKGLFIFIVVVAIIGWFLFDNREVVTDSTVPSQTVTDLGKEVIIDPKGDEEFTFNNPKKTPHYESNIPVHGSVLAEAPSNIIIDVNFDLIKDSSVSITKDGKEYGVGPSIVDNNKLALRRNMDINAPDGLYFINYKVCWPDRSCHDGYFQFAINRKLQAGYIDFRGKPEINIELRDIVFNPASVLISRGTKVTWQNNDDVSHYINTDPHPTHTYFPPQNSRELKRGDKFSMLFNNKGFYPYHCSAHAAIMTASIIVID